MLKIFGAKLSGTPFIHSTARIQIPWNLTMKHRACLGDNVNVYNLGKITILERATVAQEVYLCTGTHDFSKPNLQLLTRDITIKEDAFIGVRAMIMPGVTVGENAIVGAMSIVTKDVFIDEIVAGNPSRLINKLSILV